MAYIVARLYTGSGNRSTDELARVTIEELCPLLAQSGGLQRYSACEFSGGRIGSVSVYDSKEAADRAGKTAAEWVQKSGALQGYTLAQTMAGEVIFSYRAEGANQSHPNASGVVRVYKTPAEVPVMREALEKEASVIAKAVKGCLRYAVLRLEEGGYASFTACRTREDSEEFTAKAKESRGKSGSLLSRVFPQDPEVIESTIKAVYIQ